MSYLPSNSYNNFGFSLVSEKEIKSREEKLEEKVEGLHRHA